MALAPVVAGLGAFTLRVNRILGGLVIGAALVATATTPERLSVVTTGLTALLVWLYDRSRRGRRRQARSRRQRRRMAGRIGVVLACLALSFAYFQHEGHSLNKNSLSFSYPNVVTHGIPASLTVPYLYLEGGISGFAFAHQQGFNPASGTTASGAPLHGATIWILPRIEHFFDNAIITPSTTKAFVLMPAPINLYGWVGDLWFDWGYSGVVIGALLTGFVIAVLTRRARNLRDGSMWLLVVATVTLLFGFLEFEWLWLNTILIFLVGWMVIRFISEPTRTSLQLRPTVRPDMESRVSTREVSSLAAASDYSDGRLDRTLTDPGRSSSST